ncbi:pyridoxal phosphate-dependent aminotransferase family protein [Longimicrobium sp.]|uniref:aminotransferase class I/II-fold pyridoxal phosphate-dependent enzyme n=1 Tax=Longimicrobium sp. TaxID=2029185 RepID=UPI002E354AEF|nr:pyridoxal phosphate-dependent aminotransferase family protein [Longimicrobium sp.]HEX6041051.1 pyridoxal phosphate-dependent aminotransferase family protein [Longimicrobium sp.]
MTLADAPPPPVLAADDPPTIETPEGPRVRIDGRTYDWYRGNSYLGLQAHPDVLRAACDATMTYGLKLRDRRPAGGHPCVPEWERAANAFFGCEAATLLGSGYAGGMVVAAALAEDFEVAFVDAQSHANVWDGFAAAGWRVVPFAHRDPGALADALARELRPGERPLVVSDGMFPITGALAPAPEYLDVLRPYAGARLCLDDAHAYGVLGPDGRGTLDHFRLDGPDVLSYGTMSKAFGAAGGIVPATGELRRKIERRSAAYASTTKPPPGIVAAGAAAMRIAREQPGLRARLAGHVARVRGALRGWGLALDDGPSPILCLDGRTGLDFGAIARRMFDEERIAVLHMAGGYANVPAGGCLVFTLTAVHDDEQVDRLLDALHRAL